MDFSGTTVIRFRTALAGFHKGDVTDYISQTVNTHRDTVRKLNEQIDALERENEQLRRTAAEGDYVSELEEKAQQLIALQEENGLLKNRVHQLEYKLEEKEEAVPAEPEENLQEKELEAYRRAEAMERRVCQRTQAMKEQLEEISGQASEQFQAAMDSVKSVLAGIEDYLATLRSTSETLDAAMTEGMERHQTAAELLPKEDAE